MEEWKQCKLKDICKTNTSSYSSKDNYSFVNYLDTGNITQNVIDEVQFIDIEKDKLPSRAKRKVKYKSIIYSTVRPNQLHYGIIKEQPENFLVSTGFTVIDADEKFADADFLYYYLTQYEITEGLQAIGEQSTSAYPSIKASDLEDLDICLPSLEEQKKIASFLKSLDAKITMNNHINNNLFEQAMTLFLTEIENAKDIETVTLGSIADVKGGKRLPKGVNLISTPNSHPYIRVRDLNNVVFASLNNDYEFVDDETQKGISRYIVSENDILLSIVGTIGLTAVVDKSLESANLTENCVKITKLKQIFPEYLILYLRSKKGQEEISKGTVGAVQLKLPIKNIQSISVPILSEEKINSLKEILVALFSHISNNINENKELIDLRDALLPKLMSGELNLSDVNI